MNCFLRLGFLKEIILSLTIRLAVAKFKMAAKRGLFFKNQLQSVFHQKRTMYIDLPHHRYSSAKSKGTKVMASDCSRTSS
jgi:hypothetical protein